MNAATTKTVTAETVYNFTIRANSKSEQVPSDIDSGTLYDALDICNDYYVSIVLTDDAGFTRGWVHPCGEYSFA